MGSIGFESQLNSLIHRRTLWFPPLFVMCFALAAARISFVQSGRLPYDTLFLSSAWCQTLPEVYGCVAQISACTFVEHVGLLWESMQRSLRFQSIGPAAVGRPFGSQCEKGAVSPATTSFPWLWIGSAAVFRS